MRAAALFLLLLSGSTNAMAVTDCSQAHTSVDKLLCSSTELGQIDDQMARAFRDAFFRGRNKEALLEEQHYWIKNVRDLCNDAACLRRAYQQRTETLQGR